MFKRFKLIGIHFEMEYFKTTLEVSLGADNNYIFEAFAGFCHGSRVAGHV